MNPRIFILVVIFAALPFLVVAQKSDSAVPVRQPVHRNVIKFNPTPMLLWSVHNITFSYERIINPRQSLSIELGYLEFPTLVEDTLLGLINFTSHHKGGINATLEYRFYLSKYNTRPIPAGLYIGPYLTSYTYGFRNDFDLLYSSADSSGKLQGTYQSFNLGFELGYQFIFWKRLSVDLILVGPSLSYSWGKTKITGNLTDEQKSDLYEGIYNELVDRYPAVVEFFDINDEFKKKGQLEMVNLYFRYVIQIGFHF